jgi:hypothetical protein
MSSEKASNSPGFCPVKGQKPSLGTQTRSQNGGHEDELIIQSPEMQCKVAMN